MFDVEEKKSTTDSLNDMVMEGRYKSVTQRGQMDIILSWLLGKFLDRI